MAIFNKSDFDKGAWAGPLARALREKNIIPTGTLRRASTGVPGLTGSKLSQRASAALPIGSASRRSWPARRPSMQGTMSNVVTPAMGILSM